MDCGAKLGAETATAPDPAARGPAPPRVAPTLPANSAFGYIDRATGAILSSRTELAVARLLSFLGVGYEYGHALDVGGGRTERIDFKTGRGLIEVIDGDGDAEKYRRALGRPGAAAGPPIMAVGHPRHVASIAELDGVVAYGGGQAAAAAGGGGDAAAGGDAQTGSIFIDDESFTFDYAHVLPLVDKCSLLHGHTSSVMVELVGTLKDNLLLDFGEAKRIIRGVMAEFDHKFFVNERYVVGGDGDNDDDDDGHYRVSFDGPRGRFDLTVPRSTAYLLRGEATVENLSTEIVSLLAPRLPPNVDAVGVYIYEGHDKGSHIVSRLKGSP